MVPFVQLRRRWLLTLFILLMSAASAMAYTVILKNNGNHIEGTLLSEDQDTIRIRNKSGIEATFHKSSLDLVAMQKLNHDEKPSGKKDEPYTNKDVEERYGAHEDASKSQGPLTSAMDQVLDGLAAAVPSTQTLRDRLPAVVDSTIDAQTIKVRYEMGLVQAVRLLGVHAAQDRKECYGPESMQYLSSRLPVGSKTVIETDHTKDDAGQVLAYVYGADGKMVNLDVIRNGYGIVDEAASFDRMPEFLAAQAKAMRDMTGIWHACLPIPSLPEDEDKPPSSDTPLK